MKLFVLLSRIPYPLEKGDKLRAYHQIRYLSKEFEVVLCALNTKGKKIDKQAAFQSLKPYCVSINFIDIPRWSIPLYMLGTLFNGKPLQVGYFYNLTARNRINKLIKLHKPNYLYGQLLRVADYLKPFELPKTLDYQDVFSKGMERRMKRSYGIYRLIFSIEHKRLIRYENELFDAFNHKTIISKPDQQLIPHPDRNRIVIIPNGVDHEFFKPLKRDKTTDVVFTGNFAYPPNIDAALFLINKVMPLVWRQKPSVHVVLAGATPDHRVRALQSENVRVTGWMEDIREAYAGARVFIAPMIIGTGLQNKLLEAMSMELPCITSPLANGALMAVPGKHIMVGETKNEFARHIIRLLEDDDFASMIAKEGRNFVLENFNWEKATAKLTALMKS